MSIFGQDDPLAEMHSMSIGNRGIDGALKAWNDGTEEVRDLLKYEAEMIFECRLVKFLSRVSRKVSTTVCTSLLSMASEVSISVFSSSKHYKTLIKCLFECFKTKAALLELCKCDFSSDNLMTNVRATKVL